jgi:flagellar basal body P-ring formation protein FlgA
MRRVPLRLLPALLLVLLGAARLAAQEARVPVAARDLPRGAVLSEGDIAFRSATGGRSSESAAAGWVTRRVVRAGEELRPPAVARPDAVRSGEEVVVRVRQGTVLLTLRGTAAAGAGIGEKVWVRVGTGWRVEGVVAGPGEVTIEPPRGTK